MSGSLHPRTAEQHQFIRTIRGQKSEVSTTNCSIPPQINRASRMSDTATPQLHRLRRQKGSRPNSSELASQVGERIQAGLGIGAHFFNRNQRPYSDTGAMAA